MRIDENTLSGRFRVRKLKAEDVERILELMRGNPLFYEHHPSALTRQSALEDMAALPPGKTMDVKHFVGFHEADTLIALMDLIEDHPARDTAFLGFFMMARERQGCGIGTTIITDCAACLKRAGFQKIRLAVDCGNPQSFAFWEKNGFCLTGERSRDGALEYLLMERSL